MSLPRIIAVCGHKRCGKDTLAAYISQKYGYEHVKVSNKLKHVMGILFGFTDEQLEGSMKECIDDRWGVSPRQAMQFFGTEVMQFEIQKLLPNVNRNFWIKSLIDEKLHQPKNYVISDIRFLHEYNELKKYDLSVIKINRPSAFTKDMHVSETEFNEIPHDLMIQNEGSMDEMFTMFDSYITKTILNQTE
jgi:hypothetical protein